MKATTETNTFSTLAGEYARVLIQGEAYGIPTSVLRTIEPVPAVRRVPKAPDFFAGVANVGGRIVTVLDPAIRFGLPEDTERAPSALALLELEQALYGVLVDDLEGIRRFSEQMIEPINPLLDAKGTTFLAAMAKDGESLVYLLDPDAFIRAGLQVAEDRRSGYQAFGARLSELAAPARPQSRNRLLSFTVGDQNCAAHADAVLEVAPAAELKRTAGARGALAGLAETRSGSVPVLHTPRHLGLPEAPYTEQGRLVVLRSGEHVFGLLVNSVPGLVEVSDSQLNPAPAVTAGGQDTRFKGVAILEEGRRLLLVLDETRILSPESLETMEAKSPARNGASQPEGTREEERSFLIFTVSGLELALETAQVIEIAEYREPTRIPKAPDYVRGMISLRGGLVSVIDLRKRLGLPEAAESESRIVLASHADSTVGIIADSAREILTVPQSAVVKPSRNLAQGLDTGLLSGVIQVPGTDRAPVALDVGAVLTASPTKRRTRPRPAKKAARKSSSRKKK